MKGGMAKVGIMLPPIALIVKTIRVERPCTCARDLAKEARTTPKPEQAKAVAGIIINKEGMFCQMLRPNAIQANRNITDSCIIQTMLVESILQKRIELG